MSLEDTPNKLESVWIQRNTGNQFYEQINVSGSNLIVYHSSSGEIQADKISDFLAQYGGGGGAGTITDVSAYLSSSYISGSENQFYGTSSYALMGETASYMMGEDPDITNEYWIAPTEVAGFSHLKVNPLDGSTRTKLEAILTDIPTNSIINFLPGEYELGPSGIGLDPDATWDMKPWKIRGSGIHKTTLKLVGCSTTGRHRMFFSFNADGTEMSDLTIDCDGENQDSATVLTSGTSLVGSNIHLYRVRAIQAATYVVGSECFPLAAWAQTATQSNIVFDSCIVERPTPNQDDGTTCIMIHPLNDTASVDDSCVIRNSYVDYQTSSSGVNYSNAFSAPVVESCFSKGTTTGIYMDTWHHIRHNYRDNIIYAQSAGIDWNIQGRGSYSNKINVTHNFIQVEDTGHSGIRFLGTSSLSDKSGYLINVSDNVVLTSPELQFEGIWLRGIDHVHVTNNITSKVTIANTSSYYAALNRNYSGSFVESPPEYYYGTASYALNGLTSSYAINAGYSLSSSWAPEQISASAFYISGSTVQNFVIDNPNPVLSLRNPANTGLASIYFDYYSAVQGYQKVAIISKAQGSYAKGALYFCVNTASNADSASTNDARLTIDSGGQVGTGLGSSFGVGTQLPRDVLTVVGTGSATYARIASRGTTNDIAGINLSHVSYGNGTHQKCLIFADYAGSYGISKALYFALDNVADVRSVDKRDSKLTIYNNGAIHTSSSLSVSGSLTGSHGFYTSEESSIGGITLQTGGWPLVRPETGDSMYLGYGNRVALKDYQMTLRSAAHLGFSPLTL